MSQNLIDPSAFDELAESLGADFATELVTTFLSDAGNMLAQLNAAYSDGDADAFRRAAHSIKSNAQTFGAAPLADAARDIEMSDAMDGDAVRALETLLQKTSAALEGLING